MARSRWNGSVLDSNSDLHSLIVSLCRLQVRILDSMFWVLWWFFMCGFMLLTYLLYLLALLSFSTWSFTKDLLCTLS